MEGDTDYYRSFLSLFDSGIDSFITFTCLFFLTTYRLYGLRLTDSDMDTKVSTYFCSTLNLIYLFLVLLQFLDVTNLNINDIIVMLYILFYK